MCDRHTLWELSEGSSNYCLKLSFPNYVRNEGELSIQLEVDGMSIFVMSFAIVSGRIFNIQQENVILITRLQGTKGCYQAIHQATKVMKELAPPMLLFTCIEGVAKALGIKHIASVSSTIQVECQGRTRSELNRRSFYDVFFHSIGADKDRRKYFHISLPHVDKPLTLIKKNHRARTKLKRQYKLAIEKEICQSLSQLFPRKISGGQTL